MDANHVMEYIDLISLSVSEATKKNVVNAFKKVAKFENKIDKYLYNFDEKDIEELYIFMNLTPEGISVMTNILRNYLEWCFKNHYSKINLLHPDIINESYLCTLLDEDKISARYFTVETFDKMLKQMDHDPNPQILKTAMMCAHEGIYGKDLEDMVHLKLSDIQPDGSIKLYSQIKIYPSLELIEAIKLTADINEYQYNHKKPSPMTSLYKNDSIFKVISTQKSKTDKQSLERMYKTFLRRTLNVKMQLATGNDYIILKYIYENGAIHYVEHKLKEDGYTLQDLISSNNKVLLRNASKYMSQYGAYYVNIKELIKTYCKYTGGK